MILSTSELVNETHRTGVEFLLLGLQSAVIYLDIAEGCGPGEARQHYVKNAQGICMTVQRLLQQLTPLPLEVLELEEKMRQLRVRLASLAGALGC